MLALAGCFGGDHSNTDQDHNKQCKENCNVISTDDLSALINPAATGAGDSSLCRFPILEKTT